MKSLSPGFLSLAFFPAPLAIPETKPPTDNDSSKGPSALHTAKAHKACLCRVIEAKNDGPFSASSRQSTQQRQRALGMSPAPDRADVDAAR